MRPFLPFIFYAQFGYLYSYAPSSFTENNIQLLVTNSLARNKEEVKKIYAKMKDNCVTYFTAKTMSFMQFDKKTGEHVKIGNYYLWYLWHNDIIIFLKIGDAADFRKKTIWYRGYGEYLSNVYK